MQKSQERLAGAWGFWQDHWDHVEGLKVQSLSDLGVATSVNEFWALYERNPVSQLSKDCSLHIFRKHVKPEWEDPANVNGGHFRLLANMTTDIASQQRKIGHLWFDLVRAVVREDFSDASSVVGIAFTNKSYRQVLSVWTTTNDPSVVATVQHDLLQHTQDDFAIKFVPHKRIARSDFTTKQTRLHRRTTSAPVKYLNVDSDEEVDESEAQPLNFGGSSLLARRGVTAGGLETLHPNDSPPPQHGNTSTTVRFADVVADDSRRFNDAAHQRSKSEGQSRTIIPGNVKMANRQESETGLQQDASSGGYDLKTSDSGPLFSTPQIAAPSPMKDWSVGWSPSLLHTQTQAQTMLLQQFVQQTGGSSQAPVQPPATSQAQPQAPQQHQHHHQPQPQQHSQHQSHQVFHQQPVQMQHNMPQQYHMYGGGSAPAPLGGTPPSGVAGHAYPDPQRRSAPKPQASHQAQHDNRIIIGTVKAPPSKPLGKAPAKQPEGGVAPTAPTPTPVKSDSVAFVCRGWLYPPGLNRKERRRILFNADGHNPADVEDAMFIGEETPDGPVETPAQYDHLSKLAKEAPPS